MTYTSLDWEGDVDVPRLVELTVRDFTSYRGVHRFQFAGCFNLVQGSCGSGKTNLIRALEFALFGRTRDTPVRNLINLFHRRGCERRGAAPGCEVSAVFRVDGRDLKVERKLLDRVDGLKQMAAFDSDVVEVVSPEGFEKMVVRERDIKPVGGLSMGESIPIFVLNALAGNVEDGIGMAVLDEVFSRLHLKGKTELLSRLNGLGLEQVILLESYGFDQSTLEGYETNVVELHSGLPVI